ncbi:MAG: hypothetical protein WBA22_16050 [Candidatus Methanofastidiosia archaeon]
MKCRLSTPEDIEEVSHILKKGHRFSSMTHVGWKLDDTRQSPHDYTVILEEEKAVTGTAFFETQSKQVLGGALTVLTGGGGAVYPEENMPSKYSAMMSFAQGLAENSGHTAIITYVATNEFTYPILKKIGFHQLFHQRSQVKILNVKKMIAIAVEKLNRAGVPDTLKLVIRILPESEEPFSIRLNSGIFSLEEDTNDSDIEIAGTVRKVVASLISNAHTDVVGVLLRRQVAVRVRISSVVSILHVVRFLW